MLPTIYALATAPGRAGVAVVRISGPAAYEAYQSLTDAPQILQPRHAYLKALYDPVSQELLDKALILWFPGPHSFTGEDVIELHLHGGRAVVAGVLAALGQIADLRPAEAGEFTRRAFLNNKLDLTAVEGLADLLAAETAAQRRQALRQWEGDLARLYESWRAELIKLLAYLEADLDFADEELPEDLLAKGRIKIAELCQEMQKHLEESKGAERLREGFYVPILGAPNVGKSSLLNALAQREVAIVSPQAGATRDVLEVQLDLRGYPVTLADTAGVRAQTQDQFEQEGIRRALKRLEQADIKLILTDVQEWPTLPEALENSLDKNCLIVVNKIDLAPTFNVTEWKGISVLTVSVAQGIGLPALLEALAERAEAFLSVGPHPSLTRERHRFLVREAFEHLSRALLPALAELVVEDVRLAVRSIAALTGRIDIDDILDVIFRDFCIGK